MGDRIFNTACPLCWLPIEIMLENCAKQKDLDALLAEITHLKAIVEILEGAVDWYAGGSDTWSCANVAHHSDILTDGDVSIAGKRARAAQLKVKELKGKA